MVCCPRFLEPRNTASPRMHERRTLSCNANTSKQVKIRLHWKYSHTPHRKTTFYCACLEYMQSQSPRAWLWHPPSGKYSVSDAEEIRIVLQYLINKTWNQFMYNIMQYHLITWCSCLHQQPCHCSFYPLEFTADERMHQAKECANCCL